MTRFSVPEKCRNHYFYSVISFRRKFAQKWSSKKRVGKRLRGTRSIKNAPPGGRKWTLDRFAAPQTWENVVFCDLGNFSYPRILHSSAVSGRNSPTKYSQGFLELPSGGQKKGKTRVFWLSHVRVFFPFRLLMVTCRLDIPSCLQMCHSSLLSYFCCYVFLFCGGCVSLFLFIFIFVVLFTFHSVVSLCCLLSWWTKTRSNHKISQILIVIFCFGACIPTLSLGPDNSPTWPREEPLNCFFSCLASWSISKALKYLILLCFYTSSKICQQNGPQ